MDSAAAAAAAKRVQIEKAHNFMRQYRDPESRELKKLSANQFMDVWAHYDKDGVYSLMLIYFSPNPFLTVCLFIMWPQAMVILRAPSWMAFCVSLCPAQMLRTLVPR